MRPAPAGIIKHSPGASQYSGSRVSFSDVSRLRAAFLGEGHGDFTESDLACAAAMRTTQRDRRMRRLLGLSPRQLIVRVRVEEAVHHIVRSAIAVGVSPLGRHELSRAMDAGETGKLPRLDGDL